MGFKLGTRSKLRLKGVHPDLVKVIVEGLARSPVDFTVVEGLRTLATQRKYVASGASRTMKSRHLTGHAVDIAPWVNGGIRWDWPLYYQIAPAIKSAALDLNIPVEWGGDWTSFKDGPHWQLPWGAYPA